MLERPERRGGTAADAGLLVDVLDVVSDGLGGDAETVGERLSDPREGTLREHHHDHARPRAIW